MIFPNPPLDAHSVLGPGCEGVRAGDNYRGESLSIPRCTWTGNSSQDRLRLLFSPFQSALRQLPSGNTFVQLSSKCKTLAVGERVFNDAFKNSLC